MQAIGGIKWCNKCQTWKAVSEFRLNKSKPDKLKSQCKVCDYAQETKYKLLNPEKHNKKQNVSLKRIRRQAAAYRALMRAHPDVYPEV